MVSNIVRMAGIVKSGYDEVTTAISTISTLSQWSQEDPNLGANLKMFPSLLLKAEKLIERSECWRLKHDYIDRLLPHLKSAAYDATSIINELTYQESKVQALNRNLPHELLSSCTTNVGNWLSGYPTKVKEVHDRLGKVCDELKQVCDGYRIPEDPNEFSRAKSTSFIAEPEVFGRVEELNMVMSSMKVLGREEELNQVISLVPKTRSRKRTRQDKMIDTPESSGIDKRENLSVLAIVGVGGVGKTTLAQMVCRSKKVKDLFKIIWICVSDNFDAVRLTKEIIECAGNHDQKNDCRANDNLDGLQNILVDCLESCKFLLIMDDVWSENQSDWNLFFGPLRDACKGSMIIVTTRSHKTADITETVNMNRITLKGLEPEIYWNFFKSCAFGSNNSENYPELENIGKEIIVKLEGSPLAAKTLGGLLGICLDGQHWRNIRDSEIWQLPQEEGGILPVLQLSYQYLPSHLKKCFSFCSLFPKDYNFKETELIRFWISEGFIDPRLLPQAEIVAKNYIHTLLNRCFFGQAPKNNKEYVIHDLMHDVAQLITKDECFLIENENFERKISNNDIRHLSVFNREFKLESFKNIALSYNKLHSLIIRAGGTCGINAIKSWCREFTNVCSLSLSKSNKIKRLPDSIGNLKHLRYLDVSHTGIEQLPDSFCELYKLEFLNMEGCTAFKCFPKYSNRLISIKLLILPDSCLSNISLVGNIPNLAKAIQSDKLRVTIREGENTVGALKFINGIYGELEINELQNVSNKREAQEAELNKKELVSKLVLEWESSPSNKINESYESHEEVLEGLCPQPNLKTLLIRYYPGKTFPNWLQNDYLTNMMSFENYRNDNITTMPCLPRCLTMLKIGKCWSLTDLKNCLMPTNLPSLKDLEIHDCPYLICSSEMALPPSIQFLSLRSCGQLEDRFSNILPNLTSLTELTIRGFSRLTSISHHNVIRNLEHLTIFGCSKLESIGGREVLASVKHIDISACPKLEGTRDGRISKKNGMVCFK